MKGKFIVFEGGDGAGKDTQIDLLKAELPTEQFVFTREAGGTPLGKELRRLLLSHEYPVSDLAEAFMFLADRAQHMAELVRPSLEKGLHVISNRSWVSLMAYQVYGGQQEHLLPLVNFAHEEIYQGQAPDAIIFLDVDPEVGLERSGKRGTLDRIEVASLDFHKRVQQGFYTALKKAKNVHQIDAMRPIEDIKEEVRGIIEETCQL